MKTADLIPFILLELNEQDKYGFELTKAIETKSNGKILIKQPTLYTLLKKLEKSKFISSYWLDSEIGGKRHYYKLTENGKLQISTFPSYEFLMKNALNEDIELPVIESVSNIEIQPEKKVSIMDELLNSVPTPLETILPTEEVFAENNIDSSTELDINVSNTEILKDEKTSNNEEFASNENVVKFTEKLITEPVISEVVSNTENKTFLDVEFTIPKNEIKIDYVDYHNFKNDENYKKSKNIAQKLVLQSLATSASLILMIFICSIITSFTGRSGLYYIFFIGAILISLFYPIISLINFDKIRLKYQLKDYLPKTKQKLYICLTALLVVILICVIVNVSVKNNTFALILGIKNFESFYAPLLITSVSLLDVLYNHLLIKN